MAKADLGKNIDLETKPSTPRSRARRTATQLLQAEADETLQEWNKPAASGTENARKPRNTASKVQAKPAGQHWAPVKA